MPLSKPTIALQVAFGESIEILQNKVINLEERRLASKSQYTLSLNATWHGQKIRNLFTKVVGRSQNEGNERRKFRQIGSRNGKLSYTVPNYDLSRDLDMIEMFNFKWWDGKFRNQMADGGKGKLATGVMLNCSPGIFATLLPEWRPRQMVFQVLIIR